MARMAGGRVKRTRTVRTDSGVARLPALPQDGQRTLPAVD